MLSLSPGSSLREVRAEGFADAGPLGIAKSVDQVQIGRVKRLKSAVGRQGFNGCAPVAETLTSTRQADAALMHAQDLGAKGGLVLIDESCGVGRPLELTHLDGRRLATLLALPAKPRACEPSRGGRKRASRDPAEHRRERRVKLVGVDPSRHAGHVRNVLRSSVGGAWRL